MLKVACLSLCVMGCSAGGGGGWGSKKVGSQGSSGKIPFAKGQRVADDSGEKSCDVSPELYQVFSARFPKMCLDASKKRVVLAVCDSNNPAQYWKVTPSDQGVQIQSGARCLSSSSLTMGPCTGTVDVQAHGASFTFGMGNKCMNAKNKQGSLNLANCKAGQKKQHFYISPAAETTDGQEELTTTEHSIMTSDGEAVWGQLTVPKGARANTPAVIVAADISHVDEMELTWAKKLTAKGWIVLATSPWTMSEVEMFKAGKIQGMQMARKYTTELDVVAARMTSIVAWLKGHRYVDSRRIGGVGFCLGGHNMLELAKLNVPGVQGVVSVHGSFAPGSPLPAVVETRVLVLHGADDQKMDLVDSIGKMLDTHNAVFETTKYSKVVHSYADPTAGFDASTGQAYNPYAAGRAYASTEDFLMDVFTEGGAPYEYYVSDADKSKLIEEAVTYMDGDDELFGFIYYLKDGQQQQQSLPGVVVSHAWGGLHEHEKNVAQRLALQGYVGFAHSVFTRAEAKLTGGYDFMARIQIVGQYGGDIAKYTGRMRAAVSFLKSHSKVNARQIAVGGYCFGGGSALVTLNLNDPDVLGVVSFHGSLNANIKDIANPTARVLVLHGNDDDNINDGPRGSNSMVQGQLEDALNKHSMNWELTKFANTGHGFTEPTSADYNPLADRRSFKAYLDFLSMLFAPRQCFVSQCGANPLDVSANSTTAAACSCSAGCKAGECCPNYYEDCVYYK